MWMILLQATSGLAALTGIVYCCFSLWAAIRFLRTNRRVSSDDFTPPVSVLKPLCGVDPHAYDSLLSHCIQDYPNFEIIFGVADPQDPVVPAVERLIDEFPAASVKLVVCAQVSGSNLKVSNLLQMLPMARHEYVVVNDSDIAVPSDYLRKVMAPLAIASVGIVTCLYRGIAGKTVGSRLESLGISSDFIPGVLCARQLENGLHFAMGSTLAFRRRTLEIIGGLEAVADYLADDYELGRRITEAGLHVQLADCIVEHYLPEFSLTAFFEHQLRWARTIRSSRPAGYAGLILTYAIPWSLLSLIVSGGVTWTWLLLSTALLLRFAVLWAYERVVLRDKQIRRHWPLLPLRDCLAVLTWAACYMGRQVVWRGKKFELANGKMRPRFDATAGNNQ